MLSRSLCPPCLPSVSFCLPSCCAVPTALQSFPFVCQLWTAVLQSFTCLPAPDCCVRLSLAILDICLPALGCCVCLSLATLHICLPALDCSALQSFTFVSQSWTAVSASALQSFTFVSLHLSPSSGCCVPNPLHLSSQSFAFVSQL